MTVRLLVAALCVGLLPTQAHAYNAAEKFGAPALEGGGGGRYFSGSARDGYTCAVCHDGGEVPDVQISGLPEDGFIPGETYDIELVLPDADVASAVIELAGMDGEMKGTMGLSPAPLADEVCAPVGGEPGANATHWVDLPQGREVMAMDACGANRLRLTWTAPDEPRGAVWFHAAVVAGDASSDPDGDGVRVYAKVLPVRGGSATSAEVVSACSTGGRGGGAPLAVLAALLWIGWRGSRRRRPRA